jgi:hypothetical protein
MNDAIKGEQALRVLDAVSAELEAGATIRLQYIGGGRFLVTARDVGYPERMHRGASLLDALAQYAQAAVLQATPEPDETTDAALERYAAEGVL